MRRNEREFVFVEQYFFLNNRFKMIFVVFRNKLIFLGDWWNQNFTQKSESIFDGCRKGTVVAFSSKVIHIATQEACSCSLQLYNFYCCWIIMIVWRISNFVIDYQWRYKVRGYRVHKIRHAAKYQCIEHGYMVGLNYMPDRFLLVSFDPIWSCREALA